MGMTSSKSGRALSLAQMQYQQAPPPHERIYVIVNNVDVDIGSIYSTFTSMRMLSVSDCHIDNDPDQHNIPRAAPTFVGLDGVYLSDAAIDWIVEHDVLSSPKLKTLILTRIPRCRALRILSGIRAPNLETLEVGEGIIDDAEGASVFYDLVSRLRSLALVRCRGQIFGDAARFVECVERHPNLVGVEMAWNTAFSDALARWALSNGNRTMRQLFCDACPTTERMSNADYFAHPTLETLLCVAIGNICAKTHTLFMVKHMVSKLVPLLRKTCAVARLPLPIIWMVYKTGVIL